MRTPSPVAVPGDLMLVRRVHLDFLRLSFCGC